MTPTEYLKSNKPRFAIPRYMYHSVVMLWDVMHGRTQAVREAPTWAIALTAMYRHKFNETCPTAETLAFHAEKEFARRMRLEGVTQ